MSITPEILKEKLDSAIHEAVKQYHEKNESKKHFPVTVPLL